MKIPKSFHKTLASLPMCDLVDALAKVLGATDLILISATDKQIDIGFGGDRHVLHILGMMEYAKMAACKHCQMDAMPAAEKAE